MRELELNLSYTGYENVIEFCERSNEHPDSVKCVDFIDYLRNCKLLWV